jgi:protein deglycase
VVLSVEDVRVVGAHDIAIEADDRLAERAEEPWDMVLLPGGMPGSATLRDNEAVQALLRRQKARGGRIGAICAAPIALSAAGVLEGKKATSYPAFADQLVCGEYRDERVVVDGEVATSRGPGTALEFALELVRLLAGEAKSADLAEGMLVRRP